MSQSAEKKTINVDTNWDLSQVVFGLRAARDDWRAAHQRKRDYGGREFPSSEALKLIVDDLRGVLFPMRLGPNDLRQESEDFYVGYTLDILLQNLFQQVILELKLSHKQNDDDEIKQFASQIVKKFAHELPTVRRLLDTDVASAYRGDPAAHSVDEVLLCYPGILAIIHYRIANPLYKLGVPLLARMIAELAHAQTGIDIHPGATIGGSFFIDHGTGVVIGETTVIGEGVRIYQAVTLGAKRFEADENGVLAKGQARHPIVEDDVVIYAGATILGRITIGRGSTIGGNVWLTRSVPAASQISQANSQHKLFEAVYPS